MNSLHEWYKKQHRHAHKQIEEWLCHYTDKQDISRRSLYVDALFPGRRIRSTLLYLLCTTTRSIQSNNLEGLAITLELLHRGSIILDDFLDGDIARRGVPTFHKRHGCGAMMSIVVQFITEMPTLVTNSELTSLTAIAIQNMSFAQLSDLGFVGPNNSYRTVYSRRVLQKTSVPFSLVGAYAGFLKKQSQKNTNALIKTLELFGELYQIENDSYDDFLADKKERGTKSKFVGTISLGSSIVLDCGSEHDKHTILHALPPHRKDLSPDYADTYFAAIRKKKYIKKALEKRSRARRTLLNHIKQLPKADEKLLMALYSWVTLPEFWNHTKAAEAGFHNL